MIAELAGRSPPACRTTSSEWMAFVNSSLLASDRKRIRSLGVRSGRRPTTNGAPGAGRRSSSITVTGTRVVVPPRVVGCCAEARSGSSSSSANTRVASQFRIIRISPQGFIRARRGFLFVAKLRTSVAGDAARILVVLHQGRARARGGPPVRRSTETARRRVAAGPSEPAVAQPDLDADPLDDRLGSAGTLAAVSLPRLPVHRFTARCVAGLVLSTTPAGAAAGAPPPPFPSPVCQPPVPPPVPSPGSY